MMNRILVAVDDSPPALAAARLAIELARVWSAELDIVAVAEEGTDSEALLRHVGVEADAAGVVVTETQAHGRHAFEAILATAREGNADLIVMGRSDERGPGRPYVGSQTEHVLEFTEIPVLVVPLVS